MKDEFHCQVSSGFSHPKDATLSSQAFPTNLIAVAIFNGCNLNLRSDPDLRRSPKNCDIAQLPSCCLDLQHFVLFFCLG